VNKSCLLTLFETMVWKLELLVKCWRQGRLLVPLTVHMYLSVSSRFRHRRPRAKRENELLSILVYYIFLQTKLSLSLIGILIIDNQKVAIFME